MREISVATGLGDEVSSIASRDFEAFYRREYRRLLALATALCHDRTAAEDLTQDAFVALHRSWSRVRHYSDPAAWVRRVVVNRSVSRWRRLRTEASGLVRLGRAEPSIVIDPETDDVWAAVRGLPRRQAQVIALTYLDDLPIREVARILEIDEPTVKTHLQRGRRALATALAAIDEDDPT
jgi:RNA polymerase sigma factor (sigma-70 family)